jgi:hypothetical protein
MHTWPRGNVGRFNEYLSAMHFNCGFCVILVGWLLWLIVVIVMADADAVG